MYVPISHCFCDIIRYCSKIADFNLPYLYLAPQFRVQFRVKNFVEDLWHKKTRVTDLYCIVYIFPFLFCFFSCYRFWRWNKVIYISISNLNDTPSDHIALSGLSLDRALKQHHCQKMYRHNCTSSQTTDELLTPDGLRNLPLYILKKSTGWNSWLYQCPSTRVLLSFFNRISI